MSTSITEAFITSYEAKVHEVFQRRGSYLKDAVRLKTDVVGSTAVFQKIGKGIATTKARHGTITPMNQTHTAPSCTIADFYAGDWVDKLDESKVNINERDALASGGAMALGRKVDDQITTVLDTTSSTIITVNQTSTSVVMKGTILEWVEAAWDNDVPNDGEVYAVIPSRMWSNLMTIDQFMNADYVRADGQAFVTGPNIGVGKWKDWMGIKWKMQTGLPGAGTATAKAWIWHKTAIAYAIAASAGNVAGNQSVGADITWHGDRAAHFVNHMMSGQACMIDDTGVIESTSDESGSVITT